MEPARILLVDDEESMRFLMQEILRKVPGREAVAVATGEEALEALRHEHFDLVVTDLMMPGISGIELVEQLKQTDPAIPVIVVTSYGTIDNAVQVTRKGAFHYITKPFKPDEFLLHIDRALETAGLRREVAALRSRVGKVNGLRQIVGNSRAINKVLEVLPAIARNDASVVIYGESGTGKELIARAIHLLSTRAEGPFVTLNCGALPETLLENELFGHVKGAYSDAVSDQAGLAAEADSGSLFLDEIGEIGPPIQVKLLRFLQEREYRPLGSVKTMKSNVRIITATNRDLREMIAQGSFREDLYYRLNIIPIQLPPLRDRREDIPILANHFLQKYAHDYGKKAEGFTPEALRKMMGYRWPGNIRELENKIQQILVISPPGPIGPGQIALEEGPFGEVSPGADRTRVPEASAGRRPFDPAPSETGGSPRLDLDFAAFSMPFQDAKAALVTQFEKQYVSAALAATQGNVSRAARISGKDRRLFHQLMKKHGIEAAPFRGGLQPSRVEAPERPEERKG